MTITIRAIAVEDLRAITVLADQLGYTMSEPQMLEHIEAVIGHADCDAFVAVHENQVVGWIGLVHRIQLESSPFCEINGLVVDEGYRGKGIGAALVEKAKEWTNKKGCGRLRLRTNVKRVDAHRFYSGLGFRELKEQKVFEIAV